MPFVAIDPANGKQIAEVPFDSATEVSAKVATAHATYLKWRLLPVEERVRPLIDMARLLRERKDYFGALMTREMGKPISQAVGEAEKCAWVCDYYAEQAPHLLRAVDAPTDGSLSYWTYRPLGIVLGIMPWNFPFWQVFRFAIPSLIVGNGALLKHSSNVQGCAKLIEKSFKMAGFPKNIFRNIVIPGLKVSKIIKNPSIAAVSLTGSNKVGISVATDAASVLKKTVLELGGSDPYIVLSDADLNKSVESCIDGRILNAGQSCISAKRIIVIDVSEKKDDKTVEGDVKYEFEGDQGQGMLPKVLTVFRFIIMLSVYACTTAVVCSVFTIQHPDGKELTPPLSPTMQCVLNLVFQYFLIYLLLWIFITVEDLSSGQINLHAAKDAIESAKSTVQFAPMLCILFVATRMRALQMTSNRGAPQGWVQDGMSASSGSR